MAFRKRFRKSRKSKRRGHKGGRRMKRKTYVSTKVRGRGIPDSISVKLRKTYIGSLFNPSDGFATTPEGTIPMNHFGDDTTGITTPVNYQNYANQYSLCSILGSKINVSFLNNASTTNSPSSANYVVGLYPQNLTNQNGEGIDTFDDQMVQNRCRWKTIGPSNGNGKTFLRNYVSTRASVGHPIDEENDFKISHSYTTTEPIVFNDWTPPSNRTDWTLFCGQPTSASSPSFNANIDYIATVDYYCKFEQKVDTAQHFKHA